MNNGSINIEDLGLNETFEKIERLAALIEEINAVMEDLRTEGIDVNIKIELCH